MLKEVKIFLLEDEEKKLISIVIGEFSNFVNDFIKVVTKPNKVEKI